MASVSWTAPAANGSAITGYTVTSSPGGRTCNPPGWATACAVGFLTNGTAYTFTVVATNGVGPGPASAASNSVTPLGGPPTSRSPRRASSTLAPAQGCLVHPARTWRVRSR
jgi:hypothetical protein